MQDNENLINQLSPFEFWLYQRYGTLPDHVNMEEEESDFYRLSTAEESYIYNLENPNV